MASLNKVIIIGNVGKDPEMRFVPNGKAVVSFSVAVSSQFGELETTEWVKVEAWGKPAEFCNKYLEKGQQVFIEGRQQTDTWEDDKGKHYKTKLVASRVKSLGQRKQAESKETEVEPEDIPF